MWIKYKKKKKKKGRGCFGDLWVCAKKFICLKRLTH